MVKLSKKRLSKTYRKRSKTYRKRSKTYRRKKRTLKKIKKGGSEKATRNVTITKGENGFGFSFKGEKINNNYYWTITEIKEGGPDNLSVGDEILKVNGVPTEYISSTKEVVELFKIYNATLTLSNSNLGYKERSETITKGENGFGISFKGEKISKKNYYTITEIKEGGPDNLSVGDEILKVNGVPTKDKSSTKEVVDLFEGLDEATLTLRNPTQVRTEEIKGVSVSLFPLKQSETEEGNVYTIKGIKYGGPDNLIIGDQILDVNGVSTKNKSSIDEVIKLFTESDNKAILTLKKKEP